MSIKTIVDLIAPDNKLSDTTFILKGSSNKLFGNVTKISDAVIRYSVMTQVMKDVDIIYIGVPEGSKYPPYQFGESYVGSVWNVTDTIRSGYMIQSPGLGYTDPPCDECYQFEVTEYGEYIFIKNLISIDKLIKKIGDSKDCFKIISSIKNKYLLDELSITIGRNKVETSIELSKLGF